MLALCHCHLDHLLLQNRYFFQRNFDTHVTTCYHDTVCHVNDLFQILDSLHVLDLGDDLDLAASVLYDLAHFLNIFPGSDKGSCDKVKSVLYTKHNICQIHLTDIRHGQNRSRYIDTLMIRYKTAVYDLTYNVFSFDLFYRHLDQTVIDQDRCSDIDVIFQIFVGNSGSFRCSHDFFSCQDKLLTGYQLYLTAFKITQTNLRSFGIQQSCYRQSQFFSYFQYSVVFNQLFLMASMGKVKTCHVHACKHQFS